MTRRALVALALATLAPLASFADGMPGDATDRAPVDGAASPASSQATPASQRAATGINDVLVTPGTPATVMVSLGHINRIVTPFAAFDLWTESPEQFQTRANVFYISPAEERPITLYVTPRSDESLAIALTLVPRPIPPTEIHLRLADETGALVLPASIGAAARPDEPPLPARASPSFESGPYEEGIASVVKEIAAGSVPAGYVAAPMTAVFPRCRQTGGFAVSFDGGQRFVGAPYEVFVGVARMTGAGRLSFDERWCAAPDVVAVALWPGAQLGEGEAAEIMVLRRRAGAGPAPSRSRPSLIDASAR